MKNRLHFRQRALFSNIFKIKKNCFYCHCERPWPRSIKRGQLSNFNMNTPPTVSYYMTLLQSELESWNILCILYVLYETLRNKLSFFLAGSVLLLLYTYASFVFITYNTTTSKIQCVDWYITFSCWKMFFL